MKKTSAETQEELDQLQREAWVGDAVLGLFAREWILETEGELEGEMFIRMTSNEFLQAFGKPTAVEAEIGRVYKKEGLEKANELLKTKFLPVFLKQEKNYQNRQRQIQSASKTRGRKSKK